MMAGPVGVGVDGTLIGMLVDAGGGCKNCRCSGVIVPSIGTLNMIEIITRRGYGSVF